MLWRLFVVIPTLIVRGGTWSCTRRQCIDRGFVHVILLPAHMKFHAASNQSTDRVQKFDRLRYREQYFFQPGVPRVLLHCITHLLIVLLRFLSPELPCLLLHQYLLFLRRGILFLFVYQFAILLLQLLTPR